MTRNFLYFWSFEKQKLSLKVHPFNFHVSDQWSWWNKNTPIKTYIRRPYSFYHKFKVKISEASCKLGHIQPTHHQHIYRPNMPNNAGHNPWTHPSKSFKSSNKNSRSKARYLIFLIIWNFWCVQYGSLCHQILHYASKLLTWNVVRFVLA